MFTSKSTLIFHILSLSASISARQEDFGYLDQSALSGKPFEVLQIYRRSDPNFIQGLYFDVDRQQLLESTGLYGESYT